MYFAVTAFGRSRSRQTSGIVVGYNPNSGEFGYFWRIRLRIPKAKAAIGVSQQDAQNFTAVPKTQASND